MPNTNFGNVEDLIPQAVYTHDFFPVETLLQCRQVAGVWQLLVKWSGFDLHEATWESIDFLVLDVPALYWYYSRS